MSIQYRVVVAKKDERVEGEADADVVLSAPIDVAAEGGFDATVEFMRGRVKATGGTGRVLEVLKSGEATEVLSRLASQP